jgi:hypothetical protein
MKIEFGLGVCFYELIVSLQDLFVTIFESKIYVKEFLIVFLYRGLAPILQDCPPYIPVFLLMFQTQFKLF